MKSKLILSVFVAIIAFAGLSNAQTSTRETRVPAVPGTDTIKGSFPASAGRNFVIFENVIPANTSAECMAAQPNQGTGKTMTAAMLGMRFGPAETSFSFGVERTMTSRCQILTVRFLDKPGAYILRRSQLYVRKSGDDKRQDYLKITLKEVMVSSWQHSG